MYCNVLIEADDDKMRGMNAQACCVGKAFSGVWAECGVCVTACFLIVIKWRGLVYFTCSKAINCLNKM